jgi:hypothetical protein
MLRKTRNESASQLTAYQIPTISWINTYVRTYYLEKKIEQLLQYISQQQQPGEEMAAMKTRKQRITCGSRR